VRDRRSAATVASTTTSVSVSVATMGSTTFRVGEMSAKIGACPPVRQPTASSST
jgi:hypothetical protein